MKDKPKILITVEGGVIQGVSSTSPDVEISIIDFDNVDNESSPVIYYKAEPDDIITVDEYDTLIDTVEDEYLNKQDNEK